jgi:RNA polymerase sigma-70 factor (ECF subfamily)
MGWQPKSHSMPRKPQITEPLSNGTSHSNELPENSHDEPIEDYALTTYETGTGIGADSGRSQNRSPLLSSSSIDAIFSRLLITHRVKLNRFVARRVGNPSDAEDITQQTFVEAIASYSSFKGTSEVSTWLYGIALNLIRNFLTRSPHRKHIFESDDVLSELQMMDDGPEDRLALSELIRNIHHVVSQLPYEMQQVFIPIVFEDETYDEVASSLMIPVGTVRSRLSRARKILRKCLAEGNFEIHTLPARTPEKRHPIEPIEYDDKWF